MRQPSPWPAALAVALVAILIGAGLGSWANAQQYATKVRMTDSGNTLVVASGGTIDIESGGAFELAGTAVTASAAELNLIDGSTAGTAVASKAAVLGASKDLDTLHLVGNLTTASGVGTVAGAGNALVEIGDGAVHRTVFTLTSVSITVTDSGGANGGSGGI
jgi:hypothetical protein